MGHTVSFLLPSRNEPFLTRTVDDIFAHATGYFEVVIVLDGPSSFPVPDEKDNLIVIERRVPHGMRAAIRDAARASRGEYLLKLDAHCSIDNGFNETLAEALDDSTVAIARRYSLDAGTWERKPHAVDYFYLSCPWTHPKDFVMQSCPWMTRTGERADVLVDDTMAFQGSVWVMRRDYFFDSLDGLMYEDEADFAEHHEISMRAWLTGGRVVVSKKTWYAHLHNHPRRYYLDIPKMTKDHINSAYYWVENHFHDRVHDFDWLVEKFWPLPTESRHHRLEKYLWTENWRDFYDRIMRDSLPVRDG